MMCRGGGFIFSFSFFAPYNAVNDRNPLLTSAYFFSFFLSFYCFFLFFLFLSFSLPFSSYQLFFCFFFESHCPPPPSSPAPCLPFLCLICHGCCCCFCSCCCLFVCMCVCVWGGVGVGWGAVAVLFLSSGHVV